MGVSGAAASAYEWFCNTVLVNRWTFLFLSPVVAISLPRRVGFDWRLDGATFFVVLFLYMSWMNSEGDGGGDDGGDGDDGVGVFEMYKQYFLPLIALIVLVQGYSSRWRLSLAFYALAVIVFLSLLPTILTAIFTMATAFLAAIIGGGDSDEEEDGDDGDDDD
ncbi:hypothetical protein DM860_002519 [Cuscuta australis]|uniref:Uncharacterized protein n=1 Tax=Cuscuta australis TaxID=267555 RepID=A0A328D292_9ASTE|nr:hypothetical protein DM860_002519 [Cuscuta australis]